MKLSDLVNVSAAVSKTRSRLKKRALLSDCLRASDASTIRLIVSYLSGTLPQGRIGLGPATVNNVMGIVESGDDSTDLTDVDRIMLLLVVIMIGLLCEPLWLRVSCCGSGCSREWLSG